MIIIVGLGNPGKELSLTRHNAGFFVVDRIARLLKIKFKYEKKLLSLIARPEGKDFILVKPQTFMNRSGEAVLKLMKYYKVKPSQVWVVYDDVDLPVGMVRSRAQGSGQSSHRGIRSVASFLGTPRFSRFRVGIARGRHNFAAADHPQEPVDLKSFVLSPFNQREKPLVDRSIALAAEEIINALKEGNIASKTLTKGA